MLRQFIYLTQSVRQLQRSTCADRIRVLARDRFSDAQHGLSMRQFSMCYRQRQHTAVASKEEDESAQDIYRTRVAERLSPQVRPHPIVWGHHPGPLGKQEVEKYEQRGFLQFDNLLNGNEVQRYNDELDRLLADPNVRSDSRCVNEKSTEEVRGIWQIHKVSPVINELVKSTKLTGLARQILGSDVYVHQARINFKPAFVGKKYYWHSDFETWHAEDGMPTPRCLSFSVNLSENTYANGPLMIIAGSHKTFVSCIGATPDSHTKAGLRQQDIGMLDQESLTTLANQAGGVEVLPGPAGSAVMFDSNCIHGSTDNITPYGRRNLFLVYNSVENAIGKPFYAKSERPEYYAARDFTPV